MRLTGRSEVSLWDVTVGTVIVVVHAALEAYAQRQRRQDQRRGSSLPHDPRRPASDHLQ
jgi:hypothetical protein